MKRSVVAFLVCLLATVQVYGARIKDLAQVDGVRTNQLVGFGLVVGLNSTGDQTSQAPFTVQSLRNLLNQLGVTVPPNVNPQLRNVAAVSVHAELPPFAKPGQTIDVTISSIANAQSLRGGSLLMTQLKGADGNVYGIAQGNVIVSGLAAGGEDGSSITVNIPSAGRIPNGATVERGVPTSFNSGGTITLNLHQQDFTTVARLCELINQKLGTGTAWPVDGGSVQVLAPQDPSQRIAFVSTLENLELQPGLAPAKVIVNSRTGTVVIGSTVRVAPAAVSHGSLVVTISEDPAVSQPEAFSQGDTVVVPDTQIEVTEDASRMFLFDPGVTLDELVRAVNQVGAAPGDLVAILEALQQAGALEAQLIVI
ncbi:MAG: flagellar basal body P-ring protein FlgI [Pseudomonadota bacterium]